MKSSMSESENDSDSREDWWFIGGHLYDVNLVSIVAGAGPDERLLGRMALGREIHPESLVNNGDFGKSVLTFERQGHVLLSSLPSDVWSELETALPEQTAQSNVVREFEVHGERYLAS